jgi:hypothetical protein
MSAFQSVRVTHIVSLSLSALNGLAMMRGFTRIT